MKWISTKLVPSNSALSGLTNRERFYLTLSTLDRWEVNCRHFDAKALPAYLWPLSMKMLPCQTVRSSFTSALSIPTSNGSPSSPGITIKAILISFDIIRRRAVMAALAQQASVQPGTFCIRYKSISSQAFLSCYHLKPATNCSLGCSHFLPPRTPFPPSSFEVKIKAN